MEARVGTKFNNCESKSPLEKKLCPPLTVTFSLGIAKKIFSIKQRCDFGICRKCVVVYTFAEFVKNAQIIYLKT